MNVFYPDFLRRIDHYLKINYPHVWRTRVHDFGWFSLVFGNLLAVGLAFLVVQRQSILSIESINTMYWVGAMVLCFVVVLWAMRLLQFKIKFSNFKMILVTWLLYVLCVASLAVNLTVFTYSMVVRTASFASVSEAYGDYYYLIKNRERVVFSNAKESIELLERYGYKVKGLSIMSGDSGKLRKKMKVVRQANMYFELPKPSILLNEGMPFHKLFWKHKIGGLMAAFFLPILLFFLSIFKVRTILVSSFGVAVIYGIFDLLKPSNIEMIYMLSAASVVLFLILVVGWRRLKNWNYMTGTFMLLLGIVLFISVQSSYMELSGEEGYLMDSLKRLIPFVFAPPLIAWIVTKKNALPVKNE